jgi:hypothetical protein
MNNRKFWYNRGEKQENMKTICFALEKRLKRSEKFWWKKEPLKGKCASFTRGKVSRANEKERFFLRILRIQDKQLNWRCSEISACEFLSFS